MRLVDGSYHNVDSSEMAFKVAGSMAFRTAYEKAEPVLLEPIMEVEVTVPDEAVGAVNGDLNSRRGRLHGMEPKGGMTTIKAEVPMAEVLTYSQSLTSMTGGRGDYHMHFLRYEEVPTHIAQKLIEAAKKDERGRSGLTSRAASLAEKSLHRTEVATLESMTRVTRSTDSHTCAICERTLLIGERTDPLLAERRERVRRRLPALPGHRARARLDEGGLSDQPDGAARAAAAELLAGVAAEAAGSAAREHGRRRADPAPPLRRRARDRRGGRPLQRVAVPPHGRRDRAKSSARRRVSIVPLSGTNADVVVTVAWDISWYQYRVTLDLEHAVRLAERGHDPGELDATFTDWNAHMEDDGRIVPDLARL